MVPSLNSSSVCLLGVGVKVVQVPQHPCIYCKPNLPLSLLFSSIFDLHATVN